MNKKENEFRYHDRDDIDRKVKEHFEQKRKERVVVTTDENGNEYIHVDGEWIG